MAVIVLTCPHCATEQMAFDIVGSNQWSSELSPHGERIWNAFCTCRKCQEGVIVKLGIDTGNSIDPRQASGDPRDGYFSELSVHPSPHQTDAPTHVPKQIAREFEEALDNLQRNNWTSAGMMFRRVLQRATSSLAPKGTDFTKMRLVERIDALEEKRSITPAMKAWAHNIRLEGNDATHDEAEEFSEQRARGMKDFTELLLIYAFSLPARIAESNRDSEPKA